MKTLIVFSMLLLSVIAVTTVTTLQTQPAYSQITHCSQTQAPSSACATLGPDRSITTCNPFGQCLTNDDPSGRELGIRIGSDHHSCGQFPNSVTCTVTPP
jgi:hypothetical protein